MAIASSSSFEKAPLFSRFSRGSREFFDWDEYKKSICEEVDHILNTRSFVPFSMVDVEEQRTVLTYGLADFLHLSPQSRQEAIELSNMIKKTINAYEPRIRVSTVSIELPRPQRGALFAKIEAVVCAAECPEKNMTFPVYVGDAGGKTKK
jgi:type VI secretion system lysozyme-like protein